MLSAPESVGIAIDTFSTLAAGLYQPGFNSTSGITASLHRLGQRIMTRDGRVFRFARNGGVAMVAGSLYQATAAVAGNLAQTPSAAAIGATSVSIAALTTGVTANQYSEGWLQVDTTPGNGIMYGIDSHAAVSNGAAAVFNLYKDEAIQVALTGSSRVGLIANPYADVIVTPTTQTNICVGVPSVATAIGGYCWLQTWGPCAILINGTPSALMYGVNGGTTAGSVDKWTTAAADVTVQVIGHMMQTGVSTKNNAFFLMLAP